MHGRSRDLSLTAVHAPLSGSAHAPTRGARMRAPNNSPVYGIGGPQIAKAACEHPVTFPCGSRSRPFDRLHCASMTASERAEAPGGTSAAPEGTASSPATLRIAVLDRDSGFIQVLSKRLDRVGWEHRVLASPGPADAG